MNCKDCINSDVCNCFDDEVTETIAMNLDGEECKLFKDRSRFIELPCKACKVGDIVYKLDNYNIVELKVWDVEVTIFGTRIHAQCEYVGNCYANGSLCSSSEVCNAVFWNEEDEKLGRTIFLKKSEAETRLRELESERK